MGFVGVSNSSLATKGSSALAICHLEPLSRREFGVSLLLAGLGDVRSGLSKAASVLPGLGPSDVYYPEYFLGSWEVEQTVVDVKGGADGSGLVPDEREFEKYRRRMGKMESFILRFVEHRDHVIADRGFNARSMTTAELMNLGREGNRLASSTFDPDNPNLLTITERGSGIVREIKVTKRSFQVDPGGEGTFESSEYARIVDATEDGLFGTDNQYQPKILARRIISKYRRLDPDHVDGLRLELWYPPEPPSSAPNMVVKIRQKLKRQL